MGQLISTKRLKLTCYLLKRVTVCINQFSSLGALLLLEKLEKNLSNIKCYLLVRKCNSYLDPKRDFGQPGFTLSHGVQFDITITFPETRGWVCISMVKKLVH